MVLPWTGTAEPQAVIDAGLPTWRHGWVPPRLELATRRQLRDAGLCPGGQAPCARVTWERPAATDRVIRWAYLYRIELAAPSRVNTPEQEIALALANTAKRTCPVCGELRGYVVRVVSLGGCGPCWEAGACEGTVGAFADVVGDVVGDVAA